MWCDIFSIIPHVVGVEASFSLRRDVISWRQSKTTGKTLCEQVVIRQFARANTGILAGTNPLLDISNTENDSEMNKEAENRKLHRMAKVHDFLEMWQGSQNLHATKKESRAQNDQMTAVGYIPDTEEIIKALWSLFQHEGAAAFKCQKHFLCHHLCLQRTSLEDELKYWMSAESEESTVIQSRVMRIAHLKSFWTLKIRLTGMGT